MELVRATLLSRVYGNGQISLGTQDLAHEVRCRAKPFCPSPSERNNVEGHALQKSKMSKDTGFKTNLGDKNRDFICWIPIIAKLIFHEATVNNHKHIYASNPHGIFVTLAYFCCRHWQEVNLWRSRGQELALRCSKVVAQFETMSAFLADLCLLRSEESCFIMFLSM